MAGRQTNTTIAIALPVRLVRVLDRLAAHARARGRRDASRSALLRGAVALGIDALARSELGETVVDSDTVAKVRAALARPAQPAPHL